MKINSRWIIKIKTIMLSEEYICQHLCDLVAHKVFLGHKKKKYLITKETYI